MRRALMSAALGCLFIGGGACAQVTGVVTESTATLQFSPTQSGLGSNGLLNFKGDNESGQITAANSSGSAYQVQTLLLPNDIEFSNGATSDGRYIYTSTTTQIQVSFKNDGSVAVSPQLVSSIVPGGFGFYVDGSAPPPIDHSSGGVSIGSTFANLVRDRGAPTGTDLGGVSVSMDVTSNGSTIENISGGATLEYNARDPASPTLVTNFAGLASSLNNFGLVTPAGSSTTIGYQWGQTTLNFNLPGGLLQPGQSDTLTYTTVVTSYTRGDCLGGCDFVAYSGFGDPIGKSGGAGGALAGGLASLTGAGTGVSYARFDFILPTFTNGVVSLTATPVPEPADWALIAAGLALAGFGLRRRRANGLAARRI